MSSYLVKENLKHDEQKENNVKHDEQKENNAVKVDKEVAIIQQINYKIFRLETLLPCKTRFNCDFWSIVKTVLQILLLNLLFYVLYFYVLLPVFPNRPRFFINFEPISKIIKVLGSVNCPNGDIASSCDLCSECRLCSAGEDECSGDCWWTNQCVLKDEVVWANDKLNGYCTSNVTSFNILIEQCNLQVYPTYHSVPGEYPYHFTKPRAWKKTFAGPTLNITQGFHNTVNQDADLDIWKYLRQTNNNKEGLVTISKFTCSETSCNIHITTNKLYKRMASHGFPESYECLATFMIPYEMVGLLNVTSLSSHSKSVEIYEPKSHFHSWGSHWNSFWFNSNYSKCEMGEENGDKFITDPEECAKFFGNSIHKVYTIHDERKPYGCLYQLKKTFKSTKLKPKAPMTREGMDYTHKAVYDSGKIYYNYKYFFNTYKSTSNKSTPCKEFIAYDTDISFTYRHANTFCICKSKQYLLQSPHRMKEIYISGNPKIHIEDVMAEKILINVNQNGGDIKVVNTMVNNMTIKSDATSSNIFLNMKKGRLVVLSNKSTVCFNDGMISEQVNASTNNYFGNSDNNSIIDIYFFDKVINDINLNRYKYSGIQDSNNDTSIFVKNLYKSVILIGSDDFYDVNIYKFKREVDENINTRFKSRIPDYLKQNSLDNFRSHKYSSYALLNAQSFNHAIEHSMFDSTINHANVLDEDNKMDVSTFFYTYIWKAYNTDLNQTDKLENVYENIDTVVVRIKGLRDSGRGFFVWTKNKAFQLIDYRYIALMSLGIIKPNVRQFTLKLKDDICPKQNEAELLITIAVELIQLLLKPNENEIADARSMIRSTEFFYHRLLPNQYLCDLGLPSVLYNCIVRDKYEFHVYNGVWKARKVSTKFNRTDVSIGAKLIRQNEYIERIAFSSSLFLGVFLAFFVYYVTYKWQWDEIIRCENIIKIQELFKAKNPNHMEFQWQDTYRGVSYLHETGTPWIFTKVEDVMRLISHKPEFPGIIEEIKCCDKEGNFPLHIAIKSNAPNDTIIALYNLYPTALETKNDYGATPFHFACSYCRKDVLVYFMEKHDKGGMHKITSSEDANCRLPQDLANLNLMGEEIIKAMENVSNITDRHKGIKSFLSVNNIEWEATSPDDINNVYNKTDTEDWNELINDQSHPIFHAIMYGASTGTIIRLMQLPLEKVAEKKPKKPSLKTNLSGKKNIVVDHQGDTPLHCAVRYGRHDAVKVLLKRDWLHVKNNANHTPLQRSYSINNSLISKMLEAAEADDNGDIDYRHLAKIQKAEEATGGDDGSTDDDDDDDTEKVVEIKSRSDKKKKGILKTKNERKEHDIDIRNNKYEDSLRYFKIHRNYKIGQPTRSILMTYPVKVAKSFAMSIGNPEYMIQNYAYLSIGTLFIMVLGLILYENIYYHIIGEVPPESEFKTARYDWEIASISMFCSLNGTQWRDIRTYNRMACDYTVWDCTIMLILVLPAVIINGIHISFFGKRKAINFILLVEVSIIVCMCSFIGLFLIPVMIGRRLLFVLMFLNYIFPIQFCIFFRKYYKLYWTEYGNDVFDLITQHYDISHILAAQLVISGCSIRKRKTNLTLLNSIQQCFGGGFPYIIDIPKFFIMLRLIMFGDEDMKTGVINEAIRKYSKLEEHIVLGVRGDKYHRYGLFKGCHVMKHFSPTENKCGIMSISQLHGLTVIAKRANCLDKILKFQELLLSFQNPEESSYLKPIFETNTTKYTDNILQFLTVLRTKIEKNKRDHNSLKRKSIETEFLTNVLFHLLCCYEDAQNNNGSDDDEEQNTAGDEERKDIIKWTYRYIRNTAVEASDKNDTAPAGNESVNALKEKPFRFSTTWEELVNIYELYSLHLSLSMLHYERPYTEVMKQLSYTKEQSGFPINTILCRSHNCRTVYKNLYHAEPSFKTTGEHVFLLQQKKLDDRPDETLFWYELFVLVPLYLVILFSFPILVQYHLLYQIKNVAVDAHMDEDLQFLLLYGVLYVQFFLSVGAVEWSLASRYIVVRIRSNIVKVLCSLILGYLGFLVGTPLFWLICGMCLKPVNAIPIITSIGTIALLIYRWRSRYFVHTGDVTKTIEKCVEEYFQAKDFSSTKLLEIFCAFDKDSDHVLDINEFIRLLKSKEVALYSISDVKAIELFQEYAKIRLKRHMMIRKPVGNKYSKKKQKTKSTNLKIQSDKEKLKDAKDRRHEYEYDDNDVDNDSEELENSSGNEHLTLDFYGFKSTMQSMKEKIKTNAVNNYYKRSTVNFFGVVVEMGILIGIYIFFRTIYDLFVPLDYEETAFKDLPINTSSLAALLAALWGYIDGQWNQKKDANVIGTVIDILHRWGMDISVEETAFSGKVVDLNDEIAETLGKVASDLKRKVMKVYNTFIDDCSNEIGAVVEVIQSWSKEIQTIVMKEEENFKTIVNKLISIEEGDAAGETRKKIQADIENECKYIVKSIIYNAANGIKNLMLRIVKDIDKSSLKLAQSLEKEILDEGKKELTKVSLTDSVIYTKGKISIENDIKNICAIVMKTTRNKIKTKVNDHIKTGIDKIVDRIKIEFQNECNKLLNNIMNDMNQSLRKWLTKYMENDNDINFTSPMQKKRKKIVDDFPIKDDELVHLVSKIFQNAIQTCNIKNLNVEKVITKLDTFNVKCKNEFDISIGYTDKMVTSTFITLEETLIQSLDAIMNKINVATNVLGTRTWG